MYRDGNAPTRTPFLQTPEALIDAVELSDAALRFLQAMVKLPPCNARNSDAVAARLRMGKDKTNAARKSLRAQGHWHARKRQNRHGLIRDQRLASLTPLRTQADIEEGWAAAEEAARLGKDTTASRRLGVRILNAREWQPQPAAGSPGRGPTRRRPLTGEQTEEIHTPLPVPAPATAPVPVPVPVPAEDLPAGGVAIATEPAPPPLEGPLARYAERAERVLLQLRRSTPQLALAVPDAHELAHVAGHYLLRGEEPETIRAVVTHGLPPEGVRSPKGFVRQRLLRYLPPLPAWHAREPEAGTDGPAAAPAAGGESSLSRPGGPSDLIQQGHGWRAAFASVGERDGEGG